MPMSNTATSPRSSITAHWVAVTIAVTLLGMGYTVFSEYQNTVVRRSWAYTEWMPVLPWIGTGLAPLLQWLMLPPLALTWAGRPLRGDLHDA